MKKPRQRMLRPKSESRKVGKSQSQKVAKSQSHKVTKSEIKVSLDIPDPKHPIPNFHNRNI
jgi:hypothetical protein